MLNAQKSTQTNYTSEKSKKLQGRKKKKKL